MHAVIYATYGALEGQLSGIQPAENDSGIACYYQIVSSDLQYVRHLEP